MRLKFGGLWMLIFALCILGWGAMAFSGQNAPSAPAVKMEKQVVFVLSVAGAPNDVKAFGFDLIYPKEMMAYEKVEKGGLLKEGFSMFGANELAAGRVRVGGVATGEGYLRKGATGELVVLTFKSSGDTLPAFEMESVKDGMKGWSFSGKTAAPLDAAKALNIRKKTVSVQP